MPVQGFVRARKHQFARQTGIGALEAATRAYPFKGVPSVNLNWEVPDVDAGSIVETVAPTRGIPDLTAPLTAPILNYDDLPLLLCGIFGGAVQSTGSGTAKTWDHEPSAIAPLDGIDVFTYEFGDDVTTDWYQLGDGLLETLEITGPEGLGACSMSSTWRFGSVRSTGSTDSPVTGTVPTPDLSPDTNGVPVYLKDMGIYIADTTAGLGAGQVSDALHTFTLTITSTYDQKRYANGDQSFDIDDYGRTGWEVNLAATWAKTEDTVGTGSESDAWMSDDAVNRYVQLAFESLIEAETATPYSWTVTMPMRYYTRTEGEVGGNTVIVLEAHAFYDPDDAEDFLHSVLVCKLATADLGEVPV